MLCTITAANAPLFYEKNIRAVLQDEVLYGMAADVLADDGEWLEIETFYRYRGYIKRTDAVCTSYAPTHIVSTPFADIMLEPKVDCISIGCIPKGGRIRLTGETESYFSAVITPDGERGFVRTDALSPLIEQRTASEEAFRKAVIATAHTYLGSPYRWGGKTMQGIDCSGFCSMCYLINGEIIHRDAAIKDGFPVRPIPFAEAQPGDLLFFPGHVALYLGEKRFLHATAHAGDGGVVMNSLDPADPRFRGDLLKSLTTAGTIF